MFIIPGRYGNRTEFIRCGKHEYKPKFNGYYRIGFVQSDKSNIAFVDPEGGPMIMKNGSTIGYLNDGIRFMMNIIDIRYEDIDDKSK